MKFVINRSKWRCGGDALNKIGLGDTFLLNKEGYMCCLGQIALQCGLPADLILNVLEPVDTHMLVEPLTGKAFSPYNFMACQNTVLSKDAMMINDDPELTKAEREEALIRLFASNEIELEFTGNY
jgi:hypothetical protein